MKSSLGAVVIILLITIGYFAVKSPHRVALVAPSSEGRMLFIMSAMEWAYKEGQLDAIQGDIRITVKPDGKWEWYKSPWDDGTPPHDWKKLGLSIE